MVEKNKIYSEYQDLTNMGCSELKKWKKDPCSSMASIGNEAINRNIRLKCKKKSQWKNKDYEDAKKATSYLKRSEKIPKGKIVKGCSLSKNEIARRNWARK